MNRKQEAAVARARRRRSNAGQNIVPPAKVGALQGNAPVKEDGLGPPPLGFVEWLNARSKLTIAALEKEAIRREGKKLQ